MTPPRPRIIVAGAGFAGMSFLKHLDKSKYDITLIDRNDYHSFPPLYYQVASSGLDPTDIAFPLRREFRKSLGSGMRIHPGVIREVDISAKTVTTDLETLPYDYLVVALGTTNNFFSTPDLIDKVFTLKSTDEAMRLRDEALRRCELAALESNTEKRRAMLSFTVIGGGAAGVEIAGALGEAKRYILPKEYPEIPADDMHIYLVEGSDRLLKSMSETASRGALRGLRELLVEVHTGKVMTRYDDEAEQVTLSDGTILPSGMVIWTAGVMATPLKFISDGREVNLSAAGGRLVTDLKLEVNGAPGVYAIGDIGLQISPEYPRGLPQVAQVALQQGKYLAKAFNKGQSAPFRYRDKGSMAAIGRNRAVADIGPLHFTGFPAWVAWMAIHLMSLMSMRNKLNVLTGWVWAYFTHNTSTRMLFRGSPHPRRKSDC